MGRAGPQTRSYRMGRDGIGESAVGPDWTQGKPSDSIKSQSSSSLVHEAVTMAQVLASPITAPPLDGRSRSQSVDWAKGD
jgi:hypothetical protein